jgi:parallel beta-helix repeat protein
VFLPISATNFNFKNSEFSDGIRVDNENLKIAVISGKIHIDNNWGAAKSAGICTGNGTYSEPYIIEDLVIDSGGLGSCILIENSNVFFKIENCTVYNSAPMGVPMGGDSGIMLYNTNNSQLIKNNCLSTFVGIRLFNSYNNTISGNTANNTGGHGIEIFSSTNNTISGNTVDSGTLLYFSDSSGLILSVSDNNIIANNSMYRGRYGINIHFCRNITISKNKMYDCGLNLYGYLSSDSIIVDTTNLVNGKPVYYYNNKMNLGSDNFRNAGQLILYDCHESLIENLNVSYGSTGISLDKCNNNSITGNIASHNKNDGIYLSESYNNTIRENTLDGNFDSGIDLEYSYDNTVSNNNASDNFDGISSWICDRNIVSGNILSNNRGDGVYLHDSDFNNITDNIANKNQFSGVFLHYSSNNLITRNTLNKNSLSGVYLIASDFNTISENILIENGKCIKEENCEGNIFINNTCTGIFPLKLVIIISTISGITLIGITTILLIRRKRKRIE